MRACDPKDEPTAPVPYEPAQPPVIELPEVRPEVRPQQPIGYAKTQPAVIEVFVGETDEALVQAATMPAD